MPKPSNKRDRDKDAALRRSTLQQYKMEARGILLIALVILAVTLARYWHNIRWSFR
ncbi:MAG: hypothetical protein ACRD2U_16075 [Terriglobales bacterium]